METALNQLLLELGQVYERSPIKQYCLQNGYEWYYSLVTTAMEKGYPLILGFNWGASQNGKYSAQSLITQLKFKDQDLGSLSRIFPYCKEYLGCDFLDKASQSNYCFFRSNKENQITPEDVELCKHIFEKLIDVVQPSSILCFSAKLRDYLIENKRLSNCQIEVIEYKRGSVNMTYLAMKAILNSGVEIKFLPHPNYPITNVARSEAWEFCCS